MIKLAQIKKDITVYTVSGKGYTVLEVTKGNPYPVLVKSQTNGTVGRFLPSSLSLSKPVKP